MVICLVNCVPSGVPEELVSELLVDELPLAGFLLSISLAKCRLVCLNLSREFLNDMEILPLPLPDVLLAASN